MNTEKLLKNAIKIAAVALTSPATWSVAGVLYTNPLQRVIVQVSALVLVEGALLLGWWQLDNDRRAETPQRVLYAVLASVAYVALWSIAISHGEGAAGITFRLTLGVLLGYSVFESGILAGIRLRRSADRDVNSHRVVKRYRRKRAVEHARREIDAEFEVSTAQLVVNTDVAYEKIRLSRERRLKGAEQDHQTALERLVKGLAGGKSDGSSKTGVDGRSAGKPATAVELREQIVEAFAEDPKYVRAHLAKELGISKSKLYDVINELLEDGVLDRRGQRLHVVRTLDAVLGPNGHD
jgi:hypothetical protein